jgi:nitroimidazol reductase NimA-like FMN-containing flavoprotein (pyridoxamine 5'-phosphate oxidase superfamily)
MKKGRKSLLVFLICCLAGVVACMTFEKREVVMLNEEEKEAVEMAQEIDAEAELTVTHPEVEEGLSCNDCHEITLDAKTTATQAWMKGDYLKWTEGEGVMPRDKIWEQIVKNLGGKKADQKTFVLGTSLNNIPLTTTAEFTLDPEEKILYGFHENGTEKLLHIRANPKVSLNWHLEFEGFTDFRCIQIRGRAELIDGTSKDFEKILIEIIPYEVGAKARKMDLKQFRESVRGSMVICKITIDQATIANYDFTKDGYRIYQRWTRK